jgi:poly(3-hydroxybutyrate) depolymerase
VPIAETGAGVQGAAPPGRMNRRIQSRFAARVGPPNREISANDLMWEFFKRHRRD